jgi:hypothetical protein
MNINTKTSAVTDAEQNLSEAITQSFYGQLATINNIAERLNRINISIFGSMPCQDSVGDKKEQTPNGFIETMNAINNSMTIRLDEIEKTIDQIKTFAR